MIFNDYVASETQRRRLPFMLFFESLRLCSPWLRKGGL